MIDTKNYILIEQEGYENKTEAYNTIRVLYSQMSGITTYYDNGKYYIVQSKVLRNY